MNTLGLRAAKTAYYLQLLTTFPEIRETVTSGNRDAFAKICGKAKIPKRYVDRLRNIVLSSDPEPEQWPNWI